LPEPGGARAIMRHGRAGCKP